MLSYFGFINLIKVDEKLKQLGISHEESSQTANFRLRSQLSTFVFRNCRVASGLMENVAASYASGEPFVGFLGVPLDGTTSFPSRR
jgi:hypothetical protein